MEEEVAVDAVEEEVIEETIDNEQNEAEQAR